MLFIHIHPTTRNCSSITEHFHRVSLPSPLKTRGTSKGKIQLATNHQIQTVEIYTGLKTGDFSNWWIQPIKSILSDWTWETTSLFNSSYVSSSRKATWEKNQWKAQNEELHVWRIWEPCLISLYIGLFISIWIKFLTYLQRIKDGTERIQIHG